MKVSELWAEVENSQKEHTASGAKMAILEAHKILKTVLDSKKLPGKTIEKQLFWAGYSLKDKEGIAEALEKQKEVLEKFSYTLSDLEADEIVKKYHKVIQEAIRMPEFSTSDRIRMIVDNYFKPSSVLFWRNAAIFFGSLILIKILAYNPIGQSIIGYLLSVTNSIISWQFLILVLVLVAIVLGISAYLSNRSKVKIKED